MITDQFLTTESVYRLMHHFVHGGSGLAPDTAVFLHAGLLRFLRHQHNLHRAPAVATCALSATCKFNVLVDVVGKVGSAANNTQKPDQEETGDEHHGHEKEQKKGREGRGGIGGLVDQCCKMLIKSHFWIESVINVGIGVIHERACLTTGLTNIPFMQSGIQNMLQPHLVVAVLCHPIGPPEVYLGASRDQSLRR